MSHIFFWTQHLQTLEPVITPKNVDAAGVAQTHMMTLGLSASMDRPCQNWTLICRYLLKIATNSTLEGWGNRDRRKSFIILQNLKTC